MAIDAFEAGHTRLPIRHDVVQPNLNESHGRDTLADVEDTASNNFPKSSRELGDPDTDQHRRYASDYRAEFNAYLQSRAARLASGKAEALLNATAHSTPAPVPPLGYLQSVPRAQVPQASVYSFRPGRSSWPLHHPPRSFRSSITRASNRVSLTPSDIPFSIARLDCEDHGTAAEVLGIRPHSDVQGQDLGLNQFNVHALPTYEAVRQASEEIQNGRTAWLHAFAGVLVVFNCWGFSNAYGLFQAYYEHYFLSSTLPGTIAWIGSTQIALVFMLGVPIGGLVDLGYFRVAFHGGTVVMLLGLLLSSFCTSFYTLWLTQGVIAGLGMGSTFTAGLIALMSWFDGRKMGVAMGLAACGSCLGGIAFILLSRHFLISHGFATTMRILTALSLATMIPPAMIFRMRRQSHRKSHGRQLTFKQHMHLFADAPYLCAAGGLFFAFQGLYFGFVYLITYAVDVLHLSSTAATNLLIIMLAANLPGRFVPALISDKCIGPLNTLIPSTIISSAILWVWLANSETSVGGLTLVACFYGFASAGIQSLYAATAYSFCLETRPTSIADTQGATEETIERLGLKAGGIFTCIGLGCLSGTPLAGVLVGYRVDRQLNLPYLFAQIYAASCLLLGGCLLIIARVKKAGCAAQRA